MNNEDYGVIDGTFNEKKRNSDIDKNLKLQKLWWWLNDIYFFKFVLKLIDFFCYKINECFEAAVWMKMSPILQWETNETS